MAGTFSAYIEQQVLDGMMGSTKVIGAWVNSTMLYFGLCTTDITSTGGSTGYEFVGKEPSTVTGYQRVAIANSAATNYSMAETSGAVSVKYNNVAITFPTVAASSWGHVTHAFVCDSSSSTTTEKMLCYGELTVHKDLDVGDTASFSTGSFKITLD